MMMSVFLEQTTALMMLYVQTLMEVSLVLVMMVIQVMEFHVQIMMSVL